MNKNIFAGLALACAVAAPLTAHSATVTVDGVFADWGIQNNGTAAGWTPNADVLFTVEDQSGTYLNPGWGGQAYDAEALYLSWQTKADGQTYLNIGLITGHNPDTATVGDSYGRGDFAIDFGGDGSWDFGILTADRTTSLLQGDVVATTNADWGTGLWSGPGVYDPANSSYVTNVNGGADVGNATLAVSASFTNMGTLGGTHWFYELEIPVSVFGTHWQGASPSETFNIQWTMLCANDIILLDPSAATIPEPASLALALGGLGLLGLARRRKQ